MEFQFVDNRTTLDRLSRKVIRSHVMKGKNRGKTIPARAQKRAPVQTSIHDMPRQRQGDIRASELREEAKGTFSPFNPFAGTEYSYFAFPIQLTPPMRYMIYQFHSTVSETIYPHEFCRPSREVGSPWFKYMILDQTFLHCFFAMIASYITLFHGHSDETLEAARHYSQTLRLVNRDLSTGDIPRDSTVAVVVSLAIEGNLSGAVHRSRIHLDGLQRIIELRPGGLATLRESNRGLMQKVCRTDIEFAMLDGMSTRFGLQRASVCSAALPPSFGGSRVLAYLLTKICVPLQYVTQDVLALCCCPGRVKLEACHYQDAVISICQRLLDFSPLGGVRPHDALDDAWQLGLLTFMTTILYRLGRLRLAYSELPLKLLQARLNDDSFAQVDEYRPLLFWLLFVYGFSALEGREGQWLVPRIQALANKLEAKTWEDANKCLNQFPWIGVVHDAPDQTHHKIVIAADLILCSLVEDEKTFSVQRSGS
ncbi:hypothetical protein BDY21DRAFT_415880 [Lineolata rhizophorae]|uniref:Fungal-specific transcription factor domain-containing protein n=1 Tax=Lineolata rhizophorae TaxID=578093 RepID=A0A6A6NWX0_9PEZI|nr:hypothetical protein BDY21DRAFT_415880 [Lineolata rhizophorae]